MKCPLLISPIELGELAERAVPRARNGSAGNRRRAGCGEGHRDGDDGGKPFLSVNI